MEQETKLTRKNATYPLPESAPKWLVFITALAPIITMLSISYITYTKQTCNKLLFQEIDAMAYYALIASLFALAGNVFQPIFNKFGDLFGRKCAMLILAIPYIGSIVLSGVAQDVTLLGISFILTGMCQTTMTALVGMMIADVFTGGVRTRVMSYMQSLSAFGGMIGPIIAGRVSDTAGVRMAMFVAAIFGAAAQILLLVMYPQIKTQKKKVVIDFKGIICLLLALGPSMCAISMGGKQLAWNSPITIGMLAVSAIFFVAFCKVERRTEQPVVYLEFFKSSAIRNILFFEIGFGAMAAMTQQYFNVYCFDVMGYTATQVGSLSILVAIAVVLTPFIGAYLAKTNNFKFIFAISSVCGLVMCGLYYFVLKPGTPVWAAALCKGAQNVTSCCTLAPVNIYMANIMPADKRGVGMGLATFTQALVTSIFTAIFGAIYNGANQDISIAFGPILLVLTVLMAVRLVVTLLRTKKVEDAKAEIIRLGL